tara:strand:+ start:162 stop:620 length:459 start_codon:yes stop_codon:yes gene_type:complete
MGHYILGLSCYCHDSAAALLKNGEIIAAAQEERFTRKKHDSRFPIIIGWLLPALTNQAFRIRTLWFGITSIIIGLISPKLLYYPYKLGMKVGFVLGWINSRIILSIIFILVQQPIAILMKCFGYDPLRTKLNGEITFKETRHNNSIDFTCIF